MHHFFIPPEQVGADSIWIDGTDVAHIRQVLRMKPGDELTASVLQEGTQTPARYRCRITEITSQRVDASILWKENPQAELPCAITLFQCLPKAEKMEWVIQKAVELGISEIVPVASRRCVVKLTGSRAEHKVQRWNAIANSAAKQSQRGLVPPVRPVRTFEEAISYAGQLDILLFPYERAEGMDYTRSVLRGIIPGQSIGIFIGPEGGFEPSEAALAREAGARIISLGKRILRTETAGMALLACLMLQLDQDEEVSPQDGCSPKR